MKLEEYKLDKATVKRIGSGLDRPECVWVDDEGVFVSDNRGGISLLQEDGTPKLIGNGIGEPNGFSRRPDGSFVVAGLADRVLYQVHPDGRTEKLLDTVEDEQMGPINCATADGPDRIWISVMTRYPSWPEATLAQARDGYIARVDNGVAEIVADDLYLTNEVKVSPDGEYLYAAESGAHRICRFKILEGGKLGPKEIFGPEDFGRGAILDGFSFDPYGNIWVTVIMRNNLTVLDKDGNPHVVYEDADPQAVENFATAMAAGEATPEHLAACFTAGPICLPTSVAFTAGPNPKVLIGSIASTFLAEFDMPDLSG